MRLIVYKEKHELWCALNDRFHDFRVMVRRLVVRYDARHVLPHNRLDVLRHITFDHLVSLSHAISGSRSEAAACHKSLFGMLITIRRFG
ncbi:hypothetical protein CCR75_000553 [Bremia lactucae]|uniref:Uncharacterized protein n=1 Tax=Bremia lactucae TaxID=4779 RepID=A0A976NYR7_BRELC|nr:hypothetical protein CCR75_000553 [Bremia lactucae]